MSKFNNFIKREPAVFKILVILSIIGVFGWIFETSYAQDIGLATYQETAQVVIDKSLSQNVTASITLQSTSIQEMKIPAELEQKIRENDRVISVVITNQDNCVLGVFNDSCIMVNVKRDPTDKGIIEIQNDVKEIGDMFIDDINEFFDTNARFHSVFIHHRDETNVALDTSGVVSGRGTISAVYTMPQEATDSMYEKISSILIPKVIRDGGGFYDAALNLSKDESSRMTFSIIPMQQTSLFQLQISKNYPNQAPSIKQINPLEFLQTDELKRSDYFSGGFYPLNSLIQVVVLSPQPTSVSDFKGELIPTQKIDSEQIPTDVSKSGWIFDPDQGEMIQAKYLFGKENSVRSDQLVFAIDGQKIEQEITESDLDESIIIMAIIVAAGIGAALFYLKGYRR